MTKKIIYKICTQIEWEKAQTLGLFVGSEDDLRDGFIHFSTAEQIAGTLAKHFTGQVGLILMAVDASAFGSQLKWEPSRDGALFPHLYGVLPLEKVMSVQDVLNSKEGHHVVPEGLA